MYAPPSTKTMTEYKVLMGLAVCNGNIRLFVDLDVCLKCSKINLVLRLVLRSPVYDMDGPIFSPVNRN